MTATMSPSEQANVVYAAAGNAIRVLNADDRDACYELVERINALAYQIAPVEPLTPGRARLVMGVANDAEIRDEIHHVGDGPPMVAFEDRDGVIRVQRADRSDAHFHDALRHSIELAQSMLAIIDKADGE